MRVKSYKYITHASVLLRAYRAAFKVIQHHLNAPSCVCSENGRSVLNSGTGEICFLVGNSLTAMLNDILKTILYILTLNVKTVKYHVKIFVKMNFKCAKNFCQYKITLLEGTLKF